MSTDAVRAITFNGKFRAGQHNGVQRVADRLVRAVDGQLLAMSPATRPVVRLIAPAGCAGTSRLTVITEIEDDRPASPAWEQQRLPRLAAGSLLVNLANLAPVLHWPKVTMLHDAQFCRADSSYPWRQRLGYRLLAPLMARSSRLVLTVSDFARRDLARCGVTGQGQVRILPNGADHILDHAPDTAALDKLGLVPGRYVLLFGSTKAYKNNAVIFAAFAQPALAPWRLVVVGAGRGALHQAGLTPPHDAVFAGPCDDATLRALYEGAHCLVFPSLTEGFGLPPVEAMVCGCPVVVADRGAMPEVCGPAALFASPDDPQAWCRHILALADPVSRQALVLAGQDHAGRYSWASAGRRLLGLLLEAAQT